MILFIVVTINNNKKMFINIHNNQGSELYTQKINGICTYVFTKKKLKYIV